MLSLPDRKELRFSTDQEFVTAMLGEIERLGSVEDHRAFSAGSLAFSAGLGQIIGALKARSRQVALPSSACPTSLGGRRRAGGAPYSEGEAHPR